MIRRLIVGVVTLYARWLCMLALHELGHVMHAILSGGHVTKVSFPPLGFSQTFVDPNPRPQFVAWGGPVWGVLLPSLILLAVRSIRSRVPVVIWFFTGFCLIANGAYIGFGWMKRSGDAHDLIRDGAPMAALIGFGVVCLISGLVFLHQIPSAKWRLNLR